MDNECSIVKDLLPLYFEGMVSEDTSAFLSKHLESCTECAAKFDELYKAVEPDQGSGREVGEVTAIKMVKSRLRKRRLLSIIASVFLTLSLLFVFISFRPAAIDYGVSQIYSRQDMEDAIQVIKDEFYSWDGCKLYSINYTDDSLCQRELEYCNTLAGEGVYYAECIVFRTRFRSPIFGGGGWNENTVYDWSWYLARTEAGSWELLTWGAP